MPRFSSLVLSFFLVSTICYASSFDDYTSIHKDLIAYNVDRNTVDIARKLYPDQGKFITSLNDIIDFAAKDPGSMLLSGKYSKSYFEFIKLPANSDVLASFMRSRIDYMRPALTSGKGYQADYLSWGWSNIARASALAYKRTGERRFLDMYLETVPWAFSNLDSTRADDHSGKIADDGWSLIENGVAKREVTTAGRITAPIIEMAIITKEDLQISQTEKAKIQEYAQKSIDILRPYLKHQIVKGEIRYHLFPWTGEHEAINHMAAFAESCAFVYKLTGDNEFREYAKGFLEYFKSVVAVDESGAFSWPYQVLPKDQYDELFWKGAVTVPAIINMHASGVYITDREATGIANSFDNYVIGKFYAINANMSADEFHVTGYNSYHLGHSIGLGFPQFIFLEEWRPGTKDKVLTAIASRTDLFPTGFFIHDSDAVPYAYMLPQKAAIQE